LLPPWKRGEPYNRPTLDADVQRVKRYYFHRGFLDTTVRIEEVREDREARTVEITILIAEGPATHVAAIYVNGTLPPELPAAQTLVAHLPLQPQQRLTKAKFDASKALLLTRMQDAGYARAQVVPRTEVDTKAHTAVITFTLVPAPRTSFGHLTIDGATQVRERAIHRQLSIRAGQTYSAARLAESAEAIYGLGMFQAVTPRAQNMEELEEPLDITFDVRERKPRSLRLGLGYSTIQRFQLLAEWTHRNLFRGAQRLRLTATMGSFVQEMRGELFFPYVIRRRLNLTLSLFVRNEQEINTDPLGIGDTLFTIEDPQPDFDLFTVGGEGGLGYHFTRTLRGVTGLQLSLNDFRNVDDSIEDETDAAVTEDNILFIQFAELRWATSTNPLNPTQGHVLRGRVDHANDGFISDVSFVKLVLEARHYQGLWWNMLFATRLLVGTIAPYAGSDDIPFNLRFFAGGPGSVRGFAVRRLGPLDDEDDPIGGKSVLEASAELRFPIAGKFAGALFVDFGNVFLDSFTYKLDELRYAVGPGMRYNTPVGPLRLDVGFILDRRTDEDFGRVEFSIGQAF
jgi:outer membrane protein assembly complex protein YaeT